MAASGVGREQIRREEFVHLVDLSDDRVLIAWGAFWFRRREVDGAWVILDDSELQEAAGRRTCIGHDAEPFGEAHVEVLDVGGGVVGEAWTSTRSWVWVEGLEPDTEYRYRIHIDGREWAAGQRWDWMPSAAGGYDLEPAGSYDLGFRTFPAPDSETPAVRFVALGDYGVGIRSDSESSRRQRRGKLREDVPEGFEEAHTTAWAAQAHLLLLEIDGAEARMTPISGLLPDGTPHLMTALNRDNEIVRPPFVVRHERA